MKPDKQSTSDPPPPIPLEYCGTDLPGDLRRQAHAMAEDFGGWLRVAAALGLGGVGVLLGWLPDRAQGIGGFSMLLGSIGVAYGLFGPFPEGREEWRRIFMAVGWGIIAWAVGWLLFPHAAWLLFLAGYRLGRWWADPDNHQPPR